MAMPKGFFASYIIHSEKEGLFERVSIDNSIKDKIIDMKILATQKQKVFEFNGSQFSLGSMILQFGNIQEMLNYMKDIPNLVRVEITQK